MPEPVYLEYSPKISNILTMGTTLDVEMRETSYCPWKSPLCHSRHLKISHWKQKAALSLIIKVLKIGLSLRRESDHQSSEFCIVPPLEEYSCKFASYKQRRRRGEVFSCSPKFLVSTIWVQLVYPSQFPLQTLRLSDYAQVIVGGGNMCHFQVQFLNASFMHWYPSLSG